MADDRITDAHDKIDAARAAGRIGDEDAIRLHGAVELLAGGTAEGAYPDSELESRLAELFDIGIDGEALDPG